MGVNYTRAGNIVLHTRAPSSAKLLAEHSKTIAKVLPLYIGVKPISFDIGEHWHHVVCHHVPVPEDKRESLDDEVNKELVEWNKVEGEGKDYVSSFMLWQKEDLEQRDFVTVRITLKNKETAQHLHSQGTFLFGLHCQVAVYHRWKAKA
jgi:hypothetical protein